MKQKIIPVLICLLCLVFCGCGKMSGEKAAEMYPDIIGSWGSDPFGEEFAISLSKDGSCVLLGKSGQWRLDSDNSNDAQVILTVKTEDNEYWVQLERLQEDDDGYADLLIMDSNHKTNIYEDSVFLPGTVFIAAEAALPAIPELITEWGSYFFYEDSTLIIREDGSCIMLGQPGKWCVEKRFDTWDSLSLRVRLDNGKLYKCDILLERNIDFGYHLYIMELHDNGDFSFVYPEEEAGLPTDVAFVHDPYLSFTLDRNNPLPGSECIPVLVGSWADPESGEILATFRDDGSCTVLGEDTVWGIDYWNYDPDAEYISYGYIVKIEGKPCYIFISPHDGRKMTIHIPGEDILYSDIIKVG